MFTHVSQLHIVQAPTPNTNLLLRLVFNFLNPLPLIRTVGSDPTVSFRSYVLIASIREVLIFRAIVIPVFVTMPERACIWNDIKSPFVVIAVYIESTTDNYVRPSRVCVSGGGGIVLRGVHSTRSRGFWRIKSRRTGGLYTCEWSCLLILYMWS